MATGTRRIKIIAGALKGRVLRYPDLPRARPTMQRTKSSVFDALGDSVRGAVVLDLYAAAGGVGIEALSRGAAFAHFVENDVRMLDFLAENLSAFGVGPDRCEVHAVDVFHFLRGGPFLQIGADIIYADPPYGTDDAVHLLEFFGAIRYPRSGMLLLEHEKNIDVRVGGLERRKMKSFGHTHVSFFELQRGDPR